MKLIWAHGFRSFDTRNNLFYNANENAVFCTAGVGVVQDSKAVDQKFFDKHKEDIVALAYCPITNMVATGQMAGKDMAGQKKRPKKGGKFVNIFLWDASTCEQVGAPIFGVIQSAVR
jgi:hypothetical protein